jgi:hypothetical protein
MEERAARSSDRRRSDEAEVYRYGPFYRWVAYGTGGLVVLAIIVVGWAVVTAGLSQVNWGAYAGIATGLVCAVTSVPTLLREFSLTGERIRADGPLWTSQEVRLDAVRRVFVGGTSVEVYAAADHTPALRFHRRVQGGEDLIETLVARLPSSARVDHPSGELSDRLGDRLTAA